MGTEEQKTLQSKLGSRLPERPSSGTPGTGMSIVCNLKVHKQWRLVLD
jgi:hypothetical protein